MDIDSENHHKDCVIDRRFTYKRINHFREWLSCHDCSKSKNFPLEIYDMIIRESKHEKIDIKKLTRQDIRRHLKKHRFTDYYQYIDSITNEITGKSSLKLTPEEKEELGKLYENDRKFILRMKYPFQSLKIFKFCVGQLLFTPIRDDRFNHLIININLPSSKIYKDLINSPAILLSNEKRIFYCDLFDREFNKPSSYMRLYKYIHDIPDQTISKEDEEYVCDMFKKINEFATNKNLSFNY